MLRKLFALFIMATLASLFYIACESTGGGGSTSDKEDIEGHYEKCNSYYTKYLLCTDYCIDGGFCLETCIDAWYELFLDCCDDFDTDTICRRECYSNIEKCYNQTGPLDHETKYECWLEFTDCTILCPPPNAEKDNPEYPEED